MARITVTTDVTGTVTRQTLLDMWEQGSLGGFTNDDFDFNGDIDLGVALADNWASAPTGPRPGKLFYHQGEQLLYVWTDVLDGTGVSLWLAVGPDVFECACLTKEPVPAGAVVEPWMDRWVQLGAPANEAQQAAWYPIGVNQSGLPEPDDFYSEGDTAASGTWIRVAIDGLPRAWFPKGDTGVSESRFGVPDHYDGAFWVGVLKSGDRFSGGLSSLGSGVAARISNQIGVALHSSSHFSGTHHMYLRVKWSGHMNSL